MTNCVNQENTQPHITNGTADSKASGFVAADAAYSDAPLCPQEKRARKWFIRCLAALLSLLCLTAAVVIIVDPYFHYHKPFSFLSYRLYEERYANDGISRHFDFDAIITGTSMAQNFKPGEMDALFGTNAVKETFSGAGYQEISDNLSRALERNENLKTVLLVLDYNGLLRAYDWQQYESYPTYLYDDNPWNDTAYLFNKSILYHGILSNLRMTLADEPSTTMDEYSSWERVCGLSAILGSYNRDRIKKAENTEFGETEKEMVTQTITVNVTDLVNQYPDVTFYIMYPPYSICYFDALVLKGTLDRQLKAEQTATELLLACDNVKLFNFFERTDIICNTDNYCDDGHYNASVNSQLLQMMARDECLVTKDNYLDKLAAERAFFSSYDYEAIYQTQPAN